MYTPTSQAAAQLVAHFTAAEAEISAKFAAKRAADAMAARQVLYTSVGRRILSYA